MLEMGRWDTQMLAKGLGWFSVALGVVEFLWPGHVAKAIGFNREDHAKVVRGYGAREVAAGAMMLLKPDNPGGAWGRVGSDVVDLGSLTQAKPVGKQKIGLGIAVGLVLAALAIDLLAAKELTRQADLKPVVH